MKSIKLLCVAILGIYYCEIHGMLAGAGHFPAIAAGAPVVDFDTIFGGANPIIPEALQPKQYDAPIANAPNIRCVYFTIINNALGGVPAPAAFQVAPITAPNPINETNIYFPADGSQPTTPEAVEYSCANIDNRENSPITEWYMKMFGVIPFQNTGNPANDYIKAGLSAPAGAIDAQRIISFDAQFDENDRVQDPDTGDLVSRRDFFLRNFRRIASTSVGRVLLYRILIEIRRHNSGGNVGCLENIIPYHGNLSVRNGLRSISVTWDSWQFYFNWTLREIGINNITTTLLSIGGEGISVAGSYDSIISHKVSVDVSLFHEINHWLHYMRYPDRYENEFNNYQDGVHINGTNFSTFKLLGAVPAGAGVLPTTVGALGIYYWGTLGRGGNINISESQWCALKTDGANNEFRPDFEEIRNILGLKNVGLPGGLVFYNGDDLSENLYRMCIGLPLRFGYGTNEYYEDSRVIDKVLSCCNFWKMHYNLSPRRVRHAVFSYDNASNVQGIGRCRVSR